MASATCEILWILKILDDLKIKINLPISLMCDNKSAIQTAANPVFHERTKHLEIDIHFIREKIRSCVIKNVKVKSANQVADIFTKGLSVKQNDFLCKKLCMLDMFQLQV